jgi:hypothetical protein
MVDHLHDFHAHTFSNLPSVDPHALHLPPDPAHFDLAGMAHGGEPGDGQHLWDAQHAATPGGLPSHGHELSGVTAAGHHTGGAMHPPADARHHPDGTHAHMGAAGERFGYAPREENGHILSCTETPSTHHCHGECHPVALVSGKFGRPHHGYPGGRFGSGTHWEYSGHGTYTERGPDGSRTGNYAGW